MLVLASLMLMSGIFIAKEADDSEEIPSFSTSTEDLSDGKIAVEFPPLSVPEKEDLFKPEVDEDLYLYLTPEEKRILATLIRLECGGSSYDCQMAVASVIINRMNYWGQSLRTVVFAKNQFSPSRLINYETGSSNYPPSAKHWQVVEDICKNGPTLPYYVMYFRGGRFHSWGVPYKRIDSTYFSYSPKYM